MKNKRNENPKEETLKDILKTVSSKYKLFLAGFAIFVVGTMVASHYVPVQYTSVAKFERRSDSTTDAIGKNNRSESFEIMKLTLEDELCGEKAVEEIAEKLQLTRDLPRDQKGNLTPEGLSIKNKLVEKIQNGLKVEWEIRSPIIDQIALYCTYPDQDLAVTIPNALIEQYQNNVTEQILQRLEQSRDFLQTQALLTQKQVDQLTREKIKFESQYNTLLLCSDERLQGRIQEAQADTEDLYRQKLLASQKLDQVKGLLKASKDIELKKQLKELQNQIDLCLVINQMTELHPDVKKLRARVKQVQLRIRENQQEDLPDTTDEIFTLETGLAFQLADAQAQVDLIDAEIKRMENRLEEYQNVLVKSIPLREEYFKLTKPLDDKKKQLNQWKNLLAEAEMTLAAEQSKRRTQLTTIAMAKKSKTPQFPSLLTILGIAIGGGLTFGYVLAFIGNSMDHTIRSPHQAACEFQDFNVPVVGVVREIMTPGQKVVKHLRTTFLTLVIVLVALVSLGASTYSAVARLQNDDYPQTLKNTFRQVVYYNENNLTKWTIRS